MQTPQSRPHTPTILTIIARRLFASLVIGMGFVSLRALSSTIPSRELFCVPQPLADTTRAGWLQAQALSESLSLEVCAANTSHLYPAARELFLASSARAELVWAISNAARCGGRRATGETFFRASLAIDAGLRVDRWSSSRVGLLGDGLAWNCQPTDALCFGAAGGAGRAGRWCAEPHDRGILAASQAQPGAERTGASANSSRRNPLAARCAARSRRADGPRGDRRGFYLAEPFSAGSHFPAGHV